MTSLRYADKVVIVTGGSSGIGNGCAREFVEAGAKVVVCCNDENEGTAAAASLRSIAHSPADANFIYCDVRKSDEIRNLIEATISRYGKIDCLINNAGWHPPHKPIDDFSVEEFGDLINLNLVSIFTACKFALPYLRLTKGNIINMASLVGSMSLAAMLLETSKARITVPATRGTPTRTRRTPGGGSPHRRWLQE